MDKLKILIVEDDRSTQVLFKRGLDEEIFTKRFTDSGKTALAMYLEWKPDIIILDIGLPDMDGISVLKKIRETPDSSTTVVIATSRSDRENVLRCMEIGVQGFVVKPFRVKAISETILHYHNEQTGKAGSIDSAMTAEIVKYNWSNIESLAPNANKMRIELGMEIRIQIEGVETRLKSFITGMQHGLYLLIQCPKISGIESKLYEGNDIQVTYLHAGIIYSFNTKIVNFIKKPTRLIFLSYPESVVEQGLREKQRINCQLKATLKNVATAASCDGMVLDISVTGCRFVTTPPPPESQSFRSGEKFQLTLELPGSQHPLCVSGELRNMNRNAGRISMGIQFTESDDKAITTLENYIKTLQGFLQKPLE